MGRMERARRAAGPSATPRVRLARQRRRAPPLPGERAVRTARGCARSPLHRAVGGLGLLARTALPYLSPKTIGRSVGAMCPCKVLAIANQKGGTGETTTAASLGVALAMRGRRVLLVDADPQGDLTTSLGWNPDELEVTLATESEFTPISLTPPTPPKRPPAHASPRTPRG